ncbi:hypothetical protein A6B43_03710 [Vespertiliibacter pulmonis]|uniref:Lipoprotein NlpD n=1 Tax=Vespertiliibacter pulmonis TaxID=1443036 RepID=A0A3N4VLM7_9PAST|nr:murein hydrolase activator NlpD [Vespertiliibacter pulmonis]QLB20688.1 hypothetical protein A6B43_03710 [Vespertiliibacter pulmonis]RPE82573.1 lipoprotein NlpD [Vespertiliibacter pulmonis]
MQKSFLLLPLAAIILSACSSNPPAPIVNAQGSEMAQNSQVGVYQGSTRPIETINNSGWQAEPPIATLPTPSYSQPTYAPQPSYQPAYQPSPQPVATKPVAVAPKPTLKPTVKPKKPVPQDFTIPRDEKNAPIYSQIDKGFYNGDTYTVRKGDTMFLIAYIAGKDVKEIAKLNNMSEPYQLNVGQQIKLGKEEKQKEQQQVVTTAPAPQPIKPVEPEVTYTQAANGTAYGSDGTVTGPIKAKTGAEAPITPRPVITATTGTAPAVSKITATTGTPSSVRSTSYNQAPALSSVKWQWPTQGRVITGFSSAEGGNKGLDIAGNKGQPVKAAAAGKVVYAGNSLQGYGNLIIIKHNDDFLSAYAHNDSMKVDEQDTVKAGETIATLGSTGTNSNKLHFEIRYQGKSVDPARYLPRR